MQPHIYPTCSTIAELVSGQVVQLTHTDTKIQYLLTDSRHIYATKNSLFIALLGKQHNAHRYLLEVYKLGVKNYLVQQDVPVDILALMPQANVIKVADSLRALQQIAAHHRKQFNIPVWGITGSNGKTIVKEWLYQLLYANENIVRSPKSYNSQVGVPLSVWAIQPTHTMAIFEAGISTTAEMQHLQAIIQPTVGILTNIGSPHNEGFASNSQKIIEKLQLFKHCPVLIYPSNDEVLEQYINKHYVSSKHTALSWSFTKPSAKLYITAVNKQANKTSLTANFENQSNLQITIPFINDAAIRNAATCWLALLHYGLSQDEITKRMATLSPIAMRLDMHQGINNNLIINDTYNNDLQALRIALRFLKQQSLPKHSLILSDILESGQPPELLYQQVSNIVSQAAINRFIGIGKNIYQYRKLFKHIPATQFFKTTEAFLQHPPRFNQEAVLIKGARVFALERIAQMLIQQQHNTILEINLQALANNLAVYRSFLKPNTKIMAMVKAFSYGSGAHQVAALLAHQRVDYLGVAYADEGLSLRQAGIQLPIMVMNPQPSNIQNCIKHRLEPEIYSLTQLQQWVQHLQWLPSKNLPIKIHIKLDTGMHRLGIEPQHLPQLIKILKAHTNKLQVASVFTHLAASDEPQHNAFTLQQCKSYQKMYNQLVEAQAIPKQTLQHVLNSSGIVRFGSAWQLNMVRLGIGLYGIDSTQAGTLQHKLQAVGTLKSTISQIKHLQKGESVGYQRAEILQQASTIATLNIGYGDGVPPALGKRKGWVRLHNCQAPIIGKVCMDMLMIDISQCPQAKVGDKVILFGSPPAPSINQWATWANTSPYQILTSISTRVKRVYFQDEH